MQPTLRTTRSAGLLLLLAAAPVAAQTIATEQPYLTEVGTAMDRMMADMDVQPTGDVDRDFVAMMLPHHQGAIDMAVAQLRYGQNDQLKRIAHEIIVEQQQEIAAMKLALGQPLPASTLVPTQPGAAASSAAQPAPHHMHMEH